MKNQFALPIAFAVALHAALLFGFSKPPPRARQIEEKPERIPVVFPPPPEDEIAVVEAGERSSQPKETIDRPPPSQPEPPAVVTTSTFEMPVPPIRATADVDTKALVPVTLTRGDGDGPPGWTSFIPFDKLDQSPRTRFQPAPNYPWEAKNRGEAGEVVVEFRVDEQGQVRDPRVISSTNRVFEEPTLRAVSRWVFEPGRRDGKVVPFRMSVPVSFKLND